MVMSVYTVWISDTTSVEQHQYLTLTSSSVHVVGINIYTTQPRCSRYYLSLPSLSSSDEY